MQLPQGDQIEVEGPANLLRGILNTGGKLFLTHQHLIFNSYKFTLRPGQTNIPYTNIEMIEKRKTMFFIDNGIRVHTNSGASYDFVVNDRASWWMEFKRRVPNAIV